MSPPAAVLAAPAPVPRLGHKTVGIAARIAAAETKTLCVLREPGKCVGAFERFAERRGGPIGKIQGATGMMFAISRSCV